MAFKSNYEMIQVLEEESKYCISPGVYIYIIASDTTVAIAKLG